MTNDPQAGQASLTYPQVQAAAGAANEILGGAQQNRVLELSNDVVIAKVVLQRIASGELVVVTREQAAQIGAGPPDETTEPPVDPPGSNRAQRRASAKTGAKAGKTAKKKKTSRRRTKAT